MPSITSLTSDSPANVTSSTLSPSDFLSNKFDGLSSDVLSITVPTPQESPSSPYSTSLTAEGNPKLLEHCKSDGSELASGDSKHLPLGEVIATEGHMSAGQLLTALKKADYLFEKKTAAPTAQTWSTHSNHTIISSPTNTASAQAPNSQLAPSTIDTLDSAPKYLELLNTDNLPLVIVWEPLNVETLGGTTIDTSTLPLFGESDDTTYNTDMFSTPQVNAIEFVNSLEHLDISNIALEDMRCPFCWNPFGVIDALDQMAADPGCGEVAAFGELPFSEVKESNDPVKLPCGHLFGHTCLIKIVDSGEKLCPKCRKAMVA
jgi:hypothetical protein